MMCENCILAISALLSEVQKVVDQVNTSGKEYGTTQQRNNPTKFEIKTDGNDIEQVSSFVYLGQLPTEDGENEKDIIRRISISRGVFNKMRNVLCNRDTGYIIINNNNNK